MLTQKGLELQPVLLAMTHWGDRHKPHTNGKRVIFVERATGEPIAPMSVRSAEAAYSLRARSAPRGSRLSLNQQILRLNRRAC